MKRWQNRGEVEDSEDEDWAFSNDSQSPEQAHKRPRLTAESGHDADIQQQDAVSGQADTRPGEGHGADVPKRPSQNAGGDTDEPSLQPKLATTYGKRARPARPGATTPPPLRPATQSPTLEESAVRRSEVLYVAIPPRSPALAEEKTVQTSPRADDDDELPNPSQLIAGNRYMRPATPQNAASNLFSALSSPLSELEDSPPPAQDIFAFGSGLPSPTPAGGTAEIVQHANTDEDAATIAQMLQQDQATGTNRRRSLRARTEKQLHPYVHDRTLYQQLLKQRGVRPVHYKFVDTHDPETQDRAYSGDEDKSQEQQAGSSSSPAYVSSELGSDTLHAAREGEDITSIGLETGTHGITSGEEFPDIDAIISRGVTGGIQTGRKRRKLSHQLPAGRPQSHLAHSRPNALTHAEADGYSIPPSPPPTSSDSARQLMPRVLPSGFRLPGRATPVPLPTPQISSDVRPAHVTSNMADSEAESPPRRSRTSTATRARRPPLVDSSTESGAESEPAPDPELEERRLRREKKRIRGVLPASWLKIDLRAQQRKASPSPSRSRRSSTGSPRPAFSRPAKGVAQRVNRNSATPAQSNAILQSDDDVESDASTTARIQHADRSPGRALGPRIAQADLVDVDEMEIDYIDPMFAGSSRGPPGPSKGKKRQPRIADIFSKARSSKIDFAGEREGVGHANGSGIRAQRPKQQSSKPRPALPRAPPLSVLDAPPPSTGDDAPLPQFVRLARRQARRQTGSGRHSPSSKVLRLATKDDTDDATDVLSAWREGTIAPCSWNDGADRNVSLSLNLETADPDFRRPLQDIINLQQQRLTSPLRKQADSHGPQRVQAIHVRRPRQRQTQLQPIVLQHSSARGRTGRVDTQRRIGDHEVDHEKRLRRPIRPAGAHTQYRGAQLETLEKAFDHEHRAAAFERRINILTEAVARPGRGTVSRPLQLDRYLNEAVPAPSSPAADTHSRGDAQKQPGPQSAAPRGMNVTVRPRKRHPQHVDAESRQYRQPSEPLPDVTIVDERPANDEDTSGPILHGLGPFGTRYATDFDIEPLPLGTFFHQSTFVGSGDFAASLKLIGRDLSVVPGRMRVHVAGEVLEWGPWTEEVAAGMARIPRAITDALLTLDKTTIEVSRNEQLANVTSNIDHMLRSTVRYCSKCLAFLDQVDRRSCIQHLQRFVEDLLDIPVDTYTCTIEARGSRALQRRCWQYAIVVAKQACLLSDHHLVPTEAQHRCRELLNMAAQTLARDTLPADYDELRTFLEWNRHSRNREAGVQEDDGIITSMVILNHCLGGSGSQQSGLWQVIHEACSTDASKLDCVSGLDKVWYGLFTILPTLEVDEAGIARPGSRLRATQQTWKPVKQLVERVYELYPATSIVRGATINEYFRATLTRCYRLVTGWGWWTCEPVLGTIFDFYARRNLAGLHREESRGSPGYLDELEGCPSLEVQPHDRSFHIFLKMLAVSLLGMQKYSVYTSQKIGGIAWRFIPNHGRTYPKDADVKQADIDALRNHHDLLCTLYFASPRNHRIRLELLRNLVEHTNSHREACRLSVRAWANLTSFQASTGEPAEALRPFTTWYQDIVQATITQYRLAKVEAERDFAIAKAQGAAGITDGVLAATVASNQRQIAATLVDALAGLKRALRAASSLDAVRALVEGCAPWKAFAPFDTSERRLVPALHEALEVAKTALDRESALSLLVESQVTSEESQEYGDLSAMHELMATQMDVSSRHTRAATLLHEPISQLISNVFGADTSLEDTILTKVVDIWVQLAREAVTHSDKSWSSFIDDYSSESWHQLRNTEQRRKFEPYFLARVVENAENANDDLRGSILTAWLKSLVEREATLKYQHVLTAALLNHLTDEPLLENLPFSRDRATGTFSVGLNDIRQRRLGLLSSVLSNIRARFDGTMYRRPWELQGLRRQSTDLLKALMSAMKSNYQELQGSVAGQSADPNIQGAYVEFVQHVVSFLQQHTTDICRVDPFFTDSSAFPLPATDPTYVVGRLRSYVPKLVEGRTRKQLAVFVHTVSERAAVDRQQDYLVDQLCTAMDGVLERGSSQAPSLRHVLLTAVFPVYVEAALSTGCSWILALPILQVSSTVLGNLLYHIKLEDQDSVHAATEILTTLMKSVLEPLEQVTSHPGLLRLPHVRRVLSVIFTAAGSMLTLCSYLRRLGLSRLGVAHSLVDLHTYATAINARLEGTYDDVVLNDHHFDSDSSAPWQDTQDFARKQLHDDLKQNWHAYDGQYFIRRGNASKEVVVRLEDDERERQGVQAAIDSFCTSFKAIMVEGSAGARQHGLSGNHGIDGLMV